jgi:ribosomal protein S18 acetylase RimI-like enzyme
MEIDFQVRNTTSTEYNSLREAVGWKGYEPETIDDAQRENLYSIVVIFENKTIGMGRVIGDGKMVFYIQDIIVLPEYQRCGIGKEIMNRIMSYINENTVENSIIGLMCAKGKEEFYQKYGFSFRPSEKLGPGMTIFVSNKH